MGITSKAFTTLVLVALATVRTLAFVLISFVGLVWEREGYCVWGT